MAPYNNTVSKIAANPDKKTLIIRNAYHYDFGGAEKFAVNLAAELSKHNMQPVLITRSPQLLKHAQQMHVKHKRGWWWSRQDYSGANVLLFPFYLLWQILLTLWYVQLILHMKIDIVHPQSRDDFVAATIAGRLLRKRVVWTDHADLKYVFANHRVWYKNPVGKLVYLASKLAHYITLVSQSEQLLIETALGITLPAKYKVIHNGISDQNVVPHPRPHGEQEAIIYCSTSRLVTAKGIGELIEAFTQISRQNPSVRLWIVGYGPEADHFKQLAQHVPTITFFGHKDDALPFVAACDIFVHPSYHEGFSLSLVEAIMLGKPAIACRVGGNPEIIRDGQNGLLVPAKDAQLLAGAMLKLAKEPQTRKMYGVAAREDYVKSFVFESIVKEKFLPLYE